jgi:hypothetical protein
MRKLIALAVLALALAVLTGCSAGDGQEEQGAGAGGQVGAPTVLRGAESEAGESLDASAASIGGEVAPLPSLGPRVIQTAALRISVPRRRFEETVDRARTTAVGLGGFVISSTASQGRDRRLVRGTLVIRVPERTYAQAMKALSGLGRVEAREESGQDVSQEFVDLHARRRHLEAVETQLLRLLDRARTVAAALAVQSKLNEIQLELEQVRGRLLYLEDQVAFATISLELHERLAPVPAKGDGWSIVEAWETAGHSFLTVIGWIFVGLATAAPVLVLLLLALLARRLVLRRRIGPVGA